MEEMDAMHMNQETSQGRALEERAPVKGCTLYEGHGPPAASVRSRSAMAP